MVLLCVACFVGGVICSDKVKEGYAKALDWCKSWKH